MKRATLARGPSTDEGTFGVLLLEGGPDLRSVELPWRNSATGVSCIPPGVYRCELVNSPRHGRVYEVRDVPGRTNILLHAANFAGDQAKGWFSQLQGCIAPAMAVGSLPNPNGRAQCAGLHSKTALASLMSWAGGLPFELDVR